MTNSIPHPFFSEHWQAPEKLALPAIQQRWLDDAGSLTTHLQELGNVSVQPLYEHKDKLPADEANFLSVAPDTHSLLREVFLCVSGTPVIFARSQLPLISLTGDNKTLARMETRPLGSELFRHPAAIRQLLQACWLPTNQLPQSVQNSDTQLLARRSLFLKHNEPILVAECFLPSLWKLSE